MLTLTITLTKNTQTMIDKKNVNARVDSPWRELPFVVKPYRFGELAQMYYPDHNYDSALRHFREEMHLTRGMWKAMTDVGYREKLKLLTRAQVKTIVEFLGEP